MVGSNNRKKVGFIVEGGSEKVVIESAQFKDFLNRNGYDLVTPVIDAEGGGNLLPNNIAEFISRLERAQVDDIYILTDLEDEPDINIVRERVAHQGVTFAFIAVKALEAWYLADTLALNSWLGMQGIFEAQPEQTVGKPWDRLKELADQHGKRGPGQKIAFAKRMTRHWNFSIENAAKHPDCPSALELVNYLEQGLANANQ